ncbi:hypothetical protein [Virgibacillus sp. JSM 102003]|uniref:hypothetical protein n=1 Tax=Virgibacillus sp. JSM 102003 TaxID=1562108 RepID=UPI0035BF5D21
MTIITYVLIGLYAVLTGLAGTLQLKQTGFQVRSLLFVAVSISMLAALFIPNKNNMIIMLIAAFILLHILAVAEGIMTKSQITYSHHMIRFIAHIILVLLVYNFIVK